MSLAARSIKARGRAATVTIGGTAVPTTGLKTRAADYDDIGTVKRASTHSQYLQLPSDDVDGISIGNPVALVDADGTTGNYEVDAVLAIDVVEGITRVRLRKA